MTELSTVCVFVFVSWVVVCLTMISVALLLPDRRWDVDDPLTQIVVVFLVAVTFGFLSACITR